MKAALATLALGAALATPALADKPGADWMSMEGVIAKLKAAGYGTFSEVEADDGRWKVIADKDGQTFKLKVDPKTAEVLKSKPKKGDDDDD